MRIEYTLGSWQPRGIVLPVVAAGIFGPTPAAANGREFYNADAARLEMPDPRCATCCRACGPTLSWVPPDPLGADTSEWSIFVEPPGPDLQPAGAQASSFPPRTACSFRSARPRRGTAGIVFASRPALGTVDPFPALGVDPSSRTRTFALTAALTGAQVIGAFTGVAMIALGIGISGYSGVIIGVLGAGLFATAVVLNGILANKTNATQAELTFHSLGLFNTLTGFRFGPFWRAWIVAFNVILATISVCSALIRHELDAAWGCYGGSLPISRLTELVCTLDNSPELCFDVGEPRSHIGPTASASPSSLPSSADAVSCTGSRSVNMQSAIWTPVVLFLVEWLLVVLVAYRHKGRGKNYMKLDGDKQHHL